MSNFFSQLGLSKKETAVFLKLIELGAQPVSVIARHTGIPRSSMYFTLEQLKRQNLVELFKRKGVFYVKAIAIGNLDNLLEEKKQQLEQTKKLLQDQLPALLALENTLSITPKANFYEGTADTQQMYLDIIRREKSFCAVFNAQRVKQFFPGIHTELPKMLERSANTSRELVVNNTAGQEYLQLFSSQHHPVKLLPEEIIFDADIIIAQDAVYLTAYGKDQAAAIRMFSRELATALQVIFDWIWGKINL